jgi:hypothetical protein
VEPDSSHPTEGNGIQRTHLQREEASVRSLQRACQRQDELVVQRPWALPISSRRSEVYLQRVAPQDRLILSEPYLHTRSRAVKTAIHTQDDLTGEGRRAIGEEEVKAIGRAGLPYPTRGLLEGIVIPRSTRLLLTPYEREKERETEKHTP